MHQVLTPNTKTIYHIRALFSSAVPGCLLMLAHLANRTHDHPRVHSSADQLSDVPHSTLFLHTNTGLQHCNLPLHSRSLHLFRPLLRHGQNSHKTGHHKKRHHYHPHVPVSIIVRRLKIVLWIVSAASGVGLVTLFIIENFTELVKCRA